MPTSDPSPPPPSPNPSLSNVCQYLGHITHPGDVDALTLMAESGWLGLPSEKPFACSGAHQCTHRAPTPPSWGWEDPCKITVRLSSRRGLQQSPGHPNFPSNLGLHPQSHSLPGLCRRSCHPGVPGWLRSQHGSTSRFLLTDPQLQLPHSLQTAPQVSAGPSRDGWQLGQLGQRLHSLQAAPQPGQVLLGGEWAHGQSGACTPARNTKKGSRKPGTSHTCCRCLVVPGGAVSGCVPPSCPRPGEQVVLAGGSAARSSKGGIRG